MSMYTLIRKSPEIQEEVLFLDATGKECPVQEEFSEYEIQGPYEQCLTFLAPMQQFAPDGQENAFKEGVQYTLLVLEGNQLTIIAEPPPNPRWVPVD